MHLTPLATRPDYYVFCFDSKVSIEGDEFYDLLDSIYDELEDYFGRAVETWRHENGREYTRHSDFPAFDYGCGMCWGVLSLDS